MDVINPYQDLGLVHIVNNSEDLVRLATSELEMEDRTEWLAKVDAYLSGISWDATWGRMDDLVQEELDKNQILITEKDKEYVRLLNSGSRTGRVGTGRKIGLKSQ